jgi:arginyl-tRNA synthetase
MDEKTLEIVAVGAVKYSMLKFARESDIAFSFEDSISLEGNSGPYIQYTFARTQSVLAKKATPSKVSNSDLELEELELVRALHRFSEVVEESGNNFMPNILCQYLFELCQKYNLFYQKHKIIGGEKEEFRLSLTKAVGQVIKNGLNLLGINAPEKM